MRVHEISQWGEDALARLPVLVRMDCCRPFRWYRNMNDWRQTVLWVTYGFQQTPDTIQRQINNLGV
jgi:hypothetical protein